MARALDRFRVLPLADAPVEAPQGQPSSDLFDHYGVAIEAHPRNRPRPLVEVHACGHCGWWLSARTREPCPICGSPSPEPQTESSAG